MDTILSMAQHLEFVRSVEKRAEKVYGMAGAGHAERAALLAMSLIQFCMDEKNQTTMRVEAAGGYDLAALRVDVTSASNSETPFEEE